MKRHLARLTVMTMLAGLILAPLSGQTVKDVLDKMIEAQGGQKALETVIDSTSTGSFDLVAFGMQGTVTIYQKEPNLNRMDIEVQGMLITQAYDGQVAWSTNPQTGATTPMSELQTGDFKRQSVGNAGLLAPESLGIVYELAPRETLDGREYIVLLQKHPDGYVTTIFVDPGTYLPFKTKSKAHDEMDVEMDTETISTDYQKVEGFPYPHSLVIYRNGVEFIRIQISSVKFNSGLEAPLFKMSQ